MALRIYKKNLWFGLISATGFIILGKGTIECFSLILQKGIYIKNFSDIEI